MLISKSILKKSEKRVPVDVFFLIYSLQIEIVNEHFRQPMEKSILHLTVI